MESVSSGGDGIQNEAAQLFLISVMYRKMKNEGLAEAPSSRFTGHWRTSAWEAAGLL